MERAYREGKVRAIGVSNFYPDRFIDLQEHVEIKPAVNQVETHVFNQQIEADKYLKTYGCQIMSCGPFDEDRKLVKLMTRALPRQLCAIFCSAEL